MFFRIRCSISRYFISVCLVDMYFLRLASLDGIIWLCITEIKTSKITKMAFLALILATTYLCQYSKLLFRNCIYMPHWVTPRVLYYGLLMTCLKTFKSSLSHAKRFYGICKYSESHENLKWNLESLICIWAGWINKLYGAKWGLC